MGAKLLDSCKLCKKSFNDVERWVTTYKRGVTKNNICLKCKSEYEKQHQMGNKYQRNRRRKIKLRLIKQLGGKCGICGYDDLSILCVFDVHHLKENKKKFDITKIINTKGFKIFTDPEITKELKFCVLVCANCHRKIHYKE